MNNNLIKINYKKYGVLDYIQIMILEPSVTSLNIFEISEIPWTFETLDCIITMWPLDPIWEFFYCAIFLSKKYLKLILRNKIKM